MAISLPWFNILLCLRPFVFPQVLTRYIEQQACFSTVVPLLKMAPVLPIIRWLNVVHLHLTLPSATSSFVNSILLLYSCISISVAPTPCQCANTVVLGSKQYHFTSMCTDVLLGKSWRVRRASSPTLAMIGWVGLVTLKSSTKRYKRGTRKCQLGD